MTNSASTLLIIYTSEELSCNQQRRRCPLNRVPTGMHLPSPTDASAFTLLIIYKLEELSCNQQRRRRPLNRVPTGMHLPSPTDASAFTLLSIYAVEELLEFNRRLFSLCLHRQHREGWRCDVSTLIQRQVDFQPCGRTGKAGKIGLRTGFLQRCLGDINSKQGGGVEWTQLCNTSGSLTAL